jgi:hypothetical protein
MWEIRDTTYKTVVGKLEGKRSLERIGILH